MNDLAKRTLEEESWMVELGPRRCLESRLARAEGNELVVICHPHPLFGGSMDNPVVLLVRDVAWQLGMSTLRFNYRGVGRSDGGFGGGDGEADDLRALLAALAERDDAPQAVHLAGYSFGAWVTLKVCSTGWVPRSLLLVSPPLDFMSFRDLSVPAAPCLITAGEADDLCSQASLNSWLRTLEQAGADVRLERLPDCDHFYAKGLDALRDAVLGFLS